MLKATQPSEHRHFFLTGYAGPENKRTPSNSAATCVYVCMYACIYVCMYVCMYVYTHVVFVASVFVCMSLRMCMRICTCTCILTCCNRGLYPALSNKDISARNIRLSLCAWSRAPMLTVCQTHVYLAAAWKKPYHKHVRAYYQL